MKKEKRTLCLLILLISLIFQRLIQLTLKLSILLNKSDLNLKAFSSDGISVMTGSRGGVAAK